MLYCCFAKLNVDDSQIMLIIHAILRSSVETALSLQCLGTGFHASVICAAVSTRDRLGFAHDTLNSINSLHARKTKELKLF